jgi:hypothetical protein
LRLGIVSKIQHFPSRTYAPSKGELFILFYSIIGGKRAAVWRPTVFFFLLALPQ